MDGKSNPPTGPGSRGGVGGYTNLTVGKVSDALVATRGRKHMAAERLGVAYKTVKRFIDAHPSCQDVLDAERVRRVDRAVIANDRLVSQGYFPAVRWTLATLGKDEGWTERHEVDGNFTHGGDPDGEPIRWIERRLAPAKLREDLNGKAVGTPHPETNGG